MAQIVTGPATVQVDAIVSEAIASLGFFRPEAQAVLADRVARLWGGTPYNFQNDGDRIAPIEAKPRYSISLEIWDALTEQGRSDPTYACKATWLRVSFNIQKAAQAATEQQWRSFAAKAAFGGISEYTCQTARAKAGCTVTLNKSVLGLFSQPVPLPALPLSECGAAWCACRWDILPGD